MKKKPTTRSFTISIVLLAIAVIALGMVLGVCYAPIFSDRIVIAQETRLAKVALMPLTEPVPPISPRETIRPIVSAPVSPSYFPTTSQVIPPISAPSTAAQYIATQTATAPLPPATSKNDSFRIFGGASLGDRGGKNRNRSGMQVRSETNGGFESFTVILPGGQEEGEFLSVEDHFDTEKSTIVESAMSPWGAFRIGSWCRMRTTTASFDGGGMRTVAETKLTLLAVDNTGYVLQKETTIKMGNVTHNKPIEILKYDFLGVPTSPCQTTELPSTSLSIARKIIPSQLRQIDRISPLQHETTLLWYSPVVAPYLLQKETRIYDIQRGGKRLLSTSTTTLSKSSANILLGGNTLGWQSMTTATKEESTATTVTIHSNRVPGWILRETTTETDANGRMLFTSTTTLLDYFTARW